MALRCHPDKYSGEAPEPWPKAASEVFKRIADAYAILSRPMLAREIRRAAGRPKAAVLRLDPSAANCPKAEACSRCSARSKWWRRNAGREEARSSKPIATSPPANLEARANLALVNACQQEPHNEELAERLTLIYEAMALEPL